MPDFKGRTRKLGSIHRLERICPRSSAARICVAVSRIIPIRSRTKPWPWATSLGQEQPVGYSSQRPFERPLHGNTECWITSVVTDSNRSPSFSDAHLKSSDARRRKEMADDNHDKTDYLRNRCTYEDPESNCIVVEPPAADGEKDTVRE